MVTRIPPFCVCSLVPFSSSSSLLLSPLPPQCSFCSFLFLAPCPSLLLPLPCSFPLLAPAASSKFGSHFINRQFGLNLMMKNKAHFTLPYTLITVYCVYITHLPLEAALLGKNVEFPLIENIFSEFFEKLKVSDYCRKSKSFRLQREILKFL